MDETLITLAELIPIPFSFKEKELFGNVFKVPLFLREGFRACPEFISGVSFIVAGIITQILCVEY